MCSNDFERKLPSQVMNVTVNFDNLTLATKLHYDLRLFHYCCLGNLFKIMKMDKTRQISTEKRNQVVLFDKNGHLQQNIARIVGFVVVVRSVASRMH